jgi:hypothetical protein
MHQKMHDIYHYCELFIERKTDQNQSMLTTDFNFEDENLICLGDCRVDEPASRTPEIVSTKRTNDGIVEHCSKNKMLDVKGLKMYPAPKPKDLVISFRFTNQDVSPRPPTIATTI